MRFVLPQLARTRSQPTLTCLPPVSAARCVATSTPARPSSTTTTTPSSPQSPRKRNAANPSTKTPPLTLEHFLLRQRVLGLYRTITRALATALPRDSTQRSELAAYARGEFERHRAVADAGKIRYLVSTGKTEFEGMKRYLEEMGGR